MIESPTPSEKIGLLSKVQAYFQRTASSLAVPAYRWLFLSILFGSMRLINVFVARGWLVLTLTDSPFWVGAVVAIRGGTQILLGAFAGVLLDRVNRRLLLFAVELGTAVTAFSIGLLIYLDQIALWHIVLASFFEGMFVSVRWPALNTIIYGAVGPKRLLNASAGQFIGFNTGSIVASALAGAVIDAHGVAVAYFFAAGFGVIGASCVLFVRETYQQARVTEPFMQALQAGLHYIRHNRGLIQLVTISFVMSFFGWAHISMMPVMARDVLLTDAAGLGYLTSAGAAGALLATLTIAGLGDYGDKMKIVVRMGLVTAVALIVFALSRSFILSVAIKSIIHMGLMGFETSVMTMVLLVTSEEMQGRVQGIYTLVFGFTWLGGLAMGSIASVSGAPLAIELGGMVVLLVLLGLRRPLQQLQIASQHEEAKGL